MLIGFQLVGNYFKEFLVLLVYILHDKQNTLEIVLKVDTNFLFLIYVLVSFKTSNFPYWFPFYKLIELIATFNCIQICGKSLASAKYLPEREIFRKFLQAVLDRDPGSQSLGQGMQCPLQHKKGKGYVTWVYKEIIWVWSFYILIKYLLHSVFWHLACQYCGK